MAERKVDEQREYVRADLTTQVRIQPVTRQEFERNKSVRMDGASDVPCSGEFNISNTQLGLLVEQMIRIEEKVDRIIWKLDPERRPADAVTYGTAQNVSGAGVNLSLKEEMEIGQLVLISLSVPGFSIGFLQAYGEVVRVSPAVDAGPPSFDTSIKFLIINETEREKLISYAFCKQRQEIRGLAMRKEKDREC